MRTLLVMLFVGVFCTACANDCPWVESLQGELIVQASEGPRCEEVLFDRVFIPHGDVPGCQDAPVWDCGNCRVNWDTTCEEGGRASKVQGEFVADSDPSTFTGQVAFEVSHNGESVCSGVATGALQSFPLGR